MNPVTKVLFRIFHGEILALFPAEAATVGNPYHCLSYAHQGQHSAADPVGVICASEPAKPEQYADLKRELETRGYNLRVMRRMTAEDLETRREQLTPPPKPRAWAKCVPGTYRATCDACGEVQVQLTAHVNFNCTSCGENKWTAISQPD